MIGVFIVGVATGFYRHRHMRLHYGYKREKGGNNDQD